MTSNKPWLDGPSAKDRARAKIWQGGPFFLIGLISTTLTHFLFGYVWFGTVAIGIAGLFWFLTGVITYYTGVE
ncbi:hypothetical protein [Rhodopirellula baltica]|uniref:Uncharacterized protein n=1 Tax=Rhodopirellula baltica SWK14 TaxID=993516 RepID=L7CLN5_RHOBT|nr:hypothetical protein [Rhodopirellula baltica]ELP35209.1 hypothetical protein RBSWK_00877 [Rhodopirellula baltica SWK14]